MKRTVGLGHHLTFWATDFRSEARSASTPQICTPTDGQISHVVNQVKDQILIHPGNQKVYLKVLYHPVRDFPDQKKGLTSNFRSGSYIVNLTPPTLAIRSYSKVSLATVIDFSIYVGGYIVIHPSRLSSKVLLEVNLLVLHCFFGSYRIFSFWFSSCLSLARPVTDTACRYSCRGDVLNAILQIWQSAKYKSPMIIGNYFPKFTQCYSVMGREPIPSYCHSQSFSLSALTCFDLHPPRGTEKKLKPSPATNIYVNFSDFWGLETHQPWMIPSTCA